MPQVAVSSMDSESTEPVMLPYFEVDRTPLTEGEAKILDDAGRIIFELQAAIAKLSATNTSLQAENAFLRRALGEMQSLTDRLGKLTIDALKQVWRPT